MYKIAPLLLVLLLGCTSTPVLESAKYHPPMPASYEACPAKPLVIVKDGIPYVGFTYADSLRKAICEENKINYILSLKDIICHYREDCDKESDATSEKPDQ